MTYQRHEVVYSGDSKALYLVVDGRVAVYRRQPDGRDTLIRIAPTDEFFGDSYLVRHAAPEHAVALDDVKLMSWGYEDILERIQKEPALGIALVKYSLFESQELQDRLQAAMNLSIRKRLLCALLELSTGLGNQQRDGMVHMRSLSHRLISEYLGTSREMVTSNMNLLRNEGLIAYTRKEIAVNIDAVREVLQQTTVVDHEYVQASADAKVFAHG